jgi:beta-lactamase class D
LKYANRLSNFLFFSFVFCAQVCLSSFQIFAQKPLHKQHLNLDSIYKNFGVSGACVVFNQSKNIYYYSDTLKIQTLQTPNNSFHLYAGLIGLESGIIKNYETPNGDDTLTHERLIKALKSPDPVFFSVNARRIKKEKFQNWLNLLNYGNRDISGGLQTCWENNSLKISTKQQFDLLKKLYYYNLPFSFENIRLVKSTFHLTKLVNKNVYSFKVTGVQNGKQHAWYIGYVEFLNNTYMFVQSLESNQLSSTTFEVLNGEVMYQILHSIGVLGEEACGML